MKQTMHRNKPRYAFFAVLMALLVLFMYSGALGEGMLPLSGIDPAIAAALAAYAEEIGQPLVSLSTSADMAAGAQAVETLTLSDAAQPVADGSALAYLPGLKNLTIAGGTLTSLEGLAGHPALESLTLKDCPAMDLRPLASCPKLTSVTLEWSADYQGQGAYDLAPLASCPSLTALSLYGGCVDSLVVLTGMAGLSTLTVVDSAAADGSPIGRLTGLSSLRLYGATGEQVAAAFSGRSRRLTSAYLGHCTLTPEANAAILRQTRLKSLGFEGVQGIDTAAEGWAGLTGLTGLQMEDCALSDLGFLKGFLATTVVKLTDIALGESGTRCTVDFDKYFLKLTNVPTDQMLTMLSGDRRQWNYATIRMRDSAVDGAVLASLAGVKGLLSLDVQAVSPDAFAAENWRGFDSLQQLKLLDCERADLSFVSVLPALNRLALTGCAVENEAAIAGLRRLRGLSLVGCSLADWSFLDALSCGRNLTTLSVAGCGGPDSLAFAAALPGLTTLAMEGAGATDLTPLAGLPALENLYLYGTPIADYAPLVGLRSLRSLGCGTDAALPALTCRVERRAFVAVP